MLKIILDLFGLGKPSSRTFGTPIEARLNGKKVLLRVDAEPEANKIQIQSGRGKASLIDVRINPNQPIEPQLPKNLRFRSGKKEDLLKYIEQAARWLNG